MGKNSNISYYESEIRTLKKAYDDVGELKKSVNKYIKTHESYFQLKTGFWSNQKKYYWTGKTYNSFVKNSKASIEAAKNYEKELDNIQDKINSKRAALERKKADEEGVISKAVATGKSGITFISNFLN